MPISIKEAKHLDSYKIYFKFEDGKENIVDFKDFILNSQHPEIKKYKDIEKFKQFNIEYGDIEWSDYELCFPIYEFCSKNSFFASIK